MSKIIGWIVLLGILSGLASTAAIAATICVDYVQGLRNALQAAAANGEDDTIQVVRGTYHLGGSMLLFSSSEAHSVNVTGGFAPGCATRLRNAATTLLDGDAASAIFNISTSDDFEMHF